MARVGELTLSRLGINLVADATDRSSRAAELGTVVLGPRPRGPGIARALLLLGLALTLVELAAAYRAGPGRSPGGARPAGPAPGFNWPALVAAGLAIVAAGMLLVRGAELLKLDPDELLRPLGFASLHELAGAPGASAGEGTRVRLETSPVFAANARLDRWLTGGLLGASLLAVALLYRLERRAGRVAWPLALRLLAVAVLVAWMLPQLRAAFDREGYPDLVILVDASASMATQDGPPAGPNASTAPATPGETRLDRVRRFLADPKRDLLGKLVEGRRVRVHLYSLAEQAVPVAEASAADEVPAALAALDKLSATGESSRLGDGVEGVLHGFRGGSLTAIVVFSDGVITGGADWGRAGREAARAGVPLYLVGLGRSREVPDLGLSDLRADDTVLKGDTLVLEARLSAKGGQALPAGTRVPVVLSERVGEKLVERARQTVAIDPSGKPVPVRLSVTPSELGEKTFVLEAAAAPGEVETANNRLERQVLVTDSRKLRVLYLEGYPRYEYRFLKSLLEREAPQAGQKTIELNTVLLDASPGYAEQDKSALRSLPTKAELLLYDVVIVGDIDPEAFPRVLQTFADLGEFVKVRGGGLLVVAGTQASPGAYYGTPLGELLPVSASENPGKDTTVAVIDGYRPQLTPYGLTHPLFRLAPDEAESARQWAALRPLYWSAAGYQKKRAAEVLAVHPDRPADTAPGEAGGAGTPRGERHPLVVQQFAGAGRVLFFGFDETWRWRFRGAEEQYNQFWLQALRGLARARVGRPELRTDKQTAYRAGEPIRLTARFPDDAPVPPADVPVKVRVDRRAAKPGAPGESQVVQLAKVEGTRATYQTLLTRTPEGEYRFELTDPPPAPPPGAPAGGPPPARPRAEARVVPPPGERDSPDLDRAGLELAARESRGKFYPLEAADALVDDLPEGTRVPLNQPVPPIQLWNHALAFGLFAGLLTVEWVMRRRARLV